MKFAVVAILLSACSFHADSDQEGPGLNASGTGTARSYPAGAFTAVDLRGADDADVRVGKAFSVRAEGPTGELDKLRIDVKEGVLRIGRRSGVSMGWAKSDKVKVFVTMPELRKASIAGSGTMAVDRVTGSAFQGVIAGSGDLNVAALSVDDATFSIAGSGDVHAAGRTKALTVSVEGSGSVDAAGLRASGAKVSVAGSGDVRAAVAGQATVSVMGSGDVDLGAEARCTTAKRGSGSVRCSGSSVE